MTSIVRCLAAVAAVAGVASFAHASTNSVYTVPVGFVKNFVTNTLSGNTFTPIGIPMQRMKADQGLLTAVASNSITDSSKNWVSTNWWNPDLLHYVEFLTGNAVGRFFAITTNTATTLTLAVGSENLTTLGVSAGDRYVIRPFWRIRDIFGDVTNTPLQAASGASGADNVFLFTGSGYITIFPRKSGFPTFSTNWFQVGGSVVDNLPILPDEALYVLRRSGIPTNLVLVGEVATTNRVTVLEPGYNFVANAFPAGVTLSNSQLAAPETGFQPGTGSGTADNIFIWDPSLGSWRTVFYRIQTVPPPVRTNWFMVGGTETNNLVLEPGTGYMIYNRTSGGYWVRPLPYSP